MGFLENLFRNSLFDKRLQPKIPDGVLDVSLEDQEDIRALSSLMLAKVDDKGRLDKLSRESFSVYGKEVYQRAMKKVIEGQIKIGRHTQEAVYAKYKRIFPLI